MRTDANIYIAFLATFFVSVAVFPAVIEALRRLKAGQVISKDGPEAHQAKKGTPTMGGIVIVIAASVVAIVVSLWNRRSFAGIGFLDGRIEHVSTFLAPLVVLFLAFAVLGFLDDYLIVKRGKALGLRAREKLLGQFVIAAAFVGWLAYMRPLGPATPRILLGTGGSVVNLGWAYYVLAVFYIAGFSNAVNIADGLDGLVGGMSAITAISLAFGVVMFQAMSSIGIHTTSLILCMAIAGACLAFLWFNANPAKVFMGDTGSLALGAVFAGIAIMTKQEVALLIYGLVYIVEIASIVIQSGYFKYTRRKYGRGQERRVFKMSPLHHHFELSGWAEQLVVSRFWIACVICSTFGLLGRMWRIW